MSIVDIVTAGSVPAERTIETVTGEILEAKRTGGEAVLTIGRGLMEAKGMLSHGEWLPWLAEQVGFSERQAQRFMRLSREYSNPTLVSDLGARKALALLALPEPEREEFVELRHAIDGEEKAVADMSAAELEQAIRERDAARKAAEEALAEKSLAEQARDKMADDMKLAAAAKEQAEESLERARDEADRAADAVLAMEQELKELKSRPAEVAVEVDQGAVEKARAEAIAEMQGKLDELNQNFDKVAADRKTAREKLKTAEEALAAANARLEAAARAEKKQALSADDDMATFKVLFGQAQDQANKMHGILLKLRAREDQSAASGVQKALLALSDEIRRVAG